MKFHLLHIIWCLAQLLISFSLRQFFPISSIFFLRFGTWGEWKFKIHLLLFCCKLHRRRKLKEIHLISISVVYCIALLIDWLKFEAAAEEERKEEEVGERTKKEIFFLWSNFVFWSFDLRWSKWGRKLIEVENIERYCLIVGVLRVKYCQWRTSIDQFRTCFVLWKSSINQLKRKLLEINLFRCLSFTIYM